MAIRLKKYKTPLPASLLKQSKQLKVLRKNTTKLTTACFVQALQYNNVITIAEKHNATIPHCTTNLLY